jgi:hypothetical protein
MPLDPKTLRIGSVVKLTGKVVRLPEGVGYYVDFSVILDGNTIETDIHENEMSHAELVSEPEVTFTKEQMEAIRDKMPLYSYGGGVKFYEWLDAHVEEK